MADFFLWVKRAEKMSNIAGNKRKIMCFFMVTKIRKGKSKLGDDGEDNL